MGLKQIVVKNTFLQLVSQGVSIAVGMAVNMVLSRHLGVEGFGFYNYVFSFYFFFMSLNDFGTNTIVIREISKHRSSAGHVLASMLSFKLLVSFIALMAAWAVIESLHHPPHVKQALFIYGFMLPVLALQLPMVIFQVDLKIGLVACLGIANRIFQFLLLMWMVTHQHGISGLVFALVLADALFIPIYWAAAARLVNISIRIDFEVWRTILKSSLIIGVTGLLGYFTNQINVLLVTRLASSADAGFFSAAFRITTLFQLLPILVMNTIYPVMSRYAHENPGYLFHIYRKVTGYFILAGIALGIGTLITAPWVIRIIYGAEFAPAAGTLSVLIWSIALLYAALPAGNLLIALKKEYVGFIALATGGVINMALNFLLIPACGHLGAAWSAVAAFLAISGITLGFAEFALRRCRKQNPC